MPRLASLVAAGSSLCLMAAASIVGAPAVGAADPSVVASIPVGSTPNFISLSPDGALAYVSNIFDDNISVIDTSTNVVVANIALGPIPSGMAVLPNGDRAYVALNGTNQVAVLDLTTNQVIGPPITVQPGPSFAAATPDGSRVYVSNTAGGNGTTISVIETTTNTVVGPPITVGLGPGLLAVTANGSEVYVPNILDDSISVIDTATNVVVATIADPAIDNPEIVVFSPDGTRAYVPNLPGNLLVVIDTASRTVASTIPFPLGAPFVVAASPDGRRLYVTQRGNPVTTPGSLLTYDLQSSTLVGGPTPLQNDPVVPVVSPSSDRVYVVNRDSDTVSVIDTGLRTVAFDANGGLGAMPDQREYSPDVLRPLDFDRPGYRFTGWNTARNASGIAYPDRGLYPFAVNATLYAQWAPIELPRPLPVIAPSAPRDLVATAGDGSVAVTWREPATAGTFPIDTYSVTSSPPGGTCQTPGTAATCTVTGLTNGTEYTFTATATSLAGTSPPSAPSNAVSPQASASIQISGTRTTINSKSTIRVSGLTEGLPPGTTLRPWIRFPNQRDYRAEPTTVRLDDDGRFTWQRTTSRKVHVVFRTEDGFLESNRVVIRR